MKKAKSRTKLYTVDIYGPKVEEYQGKFLEREDDYLLLEHKKHRSPQMLEKRFSVSEILYAGTSGDYDYVCVMRERVLIDTVEGEVENLENGMIQITDTDGCIHIIDPKFAEVHAESEKRATRAVKKGKAAAAEEEDEDEEKPEKPAKKGFGKKKTDELWDEDDE